MPGPPAKRAIRAAAAIGVAAALVAHFGPRPSFLPLATRIDGPDPATARGVVVFLHGLGRGLGAAERMARDLREAGLPMDVAVVLVEGPYSTGFGHHWGHTAEEQATSRLRLRARLRELLGNAGPPRERVIISGFSQGAGVAIDTAVEEPRIGALASFSPCLSMLRGELPRRDGLRILLAHGKSDGACPVEESRSLGRVLAAANRPAQVLEFDGGHVVPPEVVRAFVAFAR